MDNFYRYSKYLKEIFGGPTYKISLDGKFSCPNRDGRKTEGGCIFCNEASFSPSRNLKNINKDPSMISAPLMSVILDITGLGVYYIITNIVM